MNKVIRLVNEGNVLKHYTDHFMSWVGPIKANGLESIGGYLHLVIEEEGGTKPMRRLQRSCHIV